MFFNLSLDKYDPWKIVLNKDEWLYNIFIGSLSNTTLIETKHYNMSCLIKSFKVSREKKINSN